MDLWNRWEEHYRRIGVDPRRICKDGVVDEPSFAAASPKALFVLREANDWPGGDLRSLLRDGPRYQTWNAVGRWAAGILRGFPDYEQIDDLDVVSEALRSIGVINVKKATGGSSANLQEVVAFAYSDRHLLRDQIESIAPDIIVACGTFEQVLWLLEPEAPPQAITNGRFSTGSQVVIQWRHPSRVDYRKTYEELGRRL